MSENEKIIRPDALPGTDRYRALGIPYPDLDTMCHGQCEGIGFYPESDTMDPLWIATHLAAGPHECDGTHFVQCPDCNGTGKRSPTSGAT